MYYELTDRFVVMADGERTWQFFSSAENLPVITPPWLGFRIVSAPADGIKVDSRLRYTIRLAGLRVGWESRIIDWSPPHQFIDLQIHGPYTLWHHQHTFEPVEGGTECRDRVIYKLPMGWAGRLGHLVAVRLQLRQIFEYRRKIIAEKLGGIRPLQEAVRIGRL